MSQNQNQRPEFLIYRAAKGIPPDRFYPVRKRIANGNGLVIYAHPDLLPLLRCVEHAPPTIRPSWGRGLDG